MDIKKNKNAILVGRSSGKRPCWEIEDSLDELAGLAKTAGYSAREKVIQNGGRINPRFFIGEGKLKEVLELNAHHGADLVIFDEDLSPAQARNLENKLECAVTDRCGLILDIFHSHARSREARTQVELARLNYLLPRLTGRWSHLSRQRGGIGLREVGEKQLEIDRRLVRNDIHRLKGKLKSIDRERAVQRKGRDQLFKAALVGYTNVGKSTLMNRLTKSDLFVKDRLFATLDACTRSLKEVDGKKILIVDTVGFIDKLPHSLVASFRSTLDEVGKADLMLKMIDISHPRFEARMASTEKVLSALGAQAKPGLWLFNKIDSLPSDTLPNNLRDRFLGSVMISAATGKGCDELISAIIRRYEDGMVERKAVIDYKKSGVLQEIRKYGRILSEEYTDAGVRVFFRVEGKRLGVIQRLIGKTD